MRFSPENQEPWKYIATYWVTNFESSLGGPHIAQYLKPMGCHVCVCMADLRWFSHHRICSHPCVGASIYYCDWTVKQLMHMNQPGVRLCRSEYTCLSSMTTDRPSASNYIHRVKRALPMITTHVDVFCHSFDYRILNNATPCISQDIQIITWA